MIPKESIRPHAHVSSVSSQLEAAQELLVEAVTAGILGDLGSGGSMDACVVTGTGAKLLRTLSSPTKPTEGWEHGRWGTTREDGQ